MQGPVSGTVLCIREIGDPYVILNSFPCGKKSRPLSIIVHKDTVSPPVQQVNRSGLSRLSLFSLERNFFQIGLPHLPEKELLAVSVHAFG